MSKLKRFHKKEAARILVELRSKTEDERLMDYRRQLLNKDDNMAGNQNTRELQERVEQACWPWPYPNLPLPPYNTIPIGYPTWPPSPQYWYPNSTSYMPETATNPYMPGFSGMEYPANFPWPMLPHQQVYVDPGQSNRRRRTKFTDEQLAVLEKTFTYGSKFPSPGERMQLESKTGLSKEKISVWFQNRRAKEKREKGQDGGSKESTTTDSELETEDERQVSSFDERSEENIELVDTRNYQSKRRFTQTHPANTPSKVIPSRLGGQCTSGFYHSEFNPGIRLPHPHIYRHTNQQRDMKQPRTEMKMNVGTDVDKTGLGQQNNNAVDVKQSCLRNVQTMTSADIMHPHSETINTRTEAKQISQKETSPIDLGPNDMTQNSQNSPIITEIKSYRSDQTEPFTHTPSITSITSLNEQLHRSDESEEKQIHQNNLTSNIKVQHPANILAYTYPPCLEDNSSASPQHRAATNCVDVGGSYHMEIAKHQRNVISDINVPHSEGESNNMPSYIVLSSPDGTIAVESAEQYHRREIKGTQNNQNTASDIKLSHPASIVTNSSTEISAPHPVGTVDNTAQDIKLPYTEAQRNTRGDMKTPHSTNVSADGPAEIKVPHSGGSVAVDLSRLYRDGNEYTSPSAPQLITSCLEGKPRKRVIDETTSSNEEPVMATHVSTSDVNSIKKDIVIADRNDGDEFRFQKKKVNTGDMVDTCTVPKQCKTSPECRIFGET